LAVVFAARTLAVAASRVSFAATVRCRRAVDFDGDLAPVERLVARVDVVFRVLVLRFAGVGFFVVVLMVSAILVDQPLRVVLQVERIELGTKSLRVFPSNTCL
jgi:hypothetical protein